MQVNLLSIVIASALFVTSSLGAPLAAMAAQMALKEVGHAAMKEAKGIAQHAAADAIKNTASHALGAVGQPPAGYPPAGYAPAAPIQYAQAPAPIQYAPAPAAPVQYAPAPAPVQYAQHPPVQYAPAPPQAAYAAGPVQQAPPAYAQPLQQASAYAPQPQPLQYAQPQAPPQYAH